MAKPKYTHEEMINIMLSDPEVKKAYDELEPEFELLSARLKAGKTQEEVAKLMHTTKSVVSRLEHSGGKKNHSPSVDTLRRYAQALGCKLTIQLTPYKSQDINHKNR
ncbi:MAG: helix-turn-helix transcriptional regulator [Burkholderiales bacterium]|nr:helix-turn-helix transcriptional regulator [Burkholderiales bacterium]